jgi:heme-degrading monooxygenase HmoA
MVVGMFGFRLRADADRESFQRVALRMYEVVSQTSEFGFVGMQTYVAPDGEQIIVGRFESAEGLSAWGEHPEHLAVQQRARDEFFESYWGGVVTIDYEFDRERGRRPPLPG